MTFLRILGSAGGHRRMWHNEAPRSKCVAEGAERLRLVAWKVWTSELKAPENGTMIMYDKLQLCLPPT
jgi:hypothetical protein